MTKLDKLMEEIAEEHVSGKRCPQWCMDFSQELQCSLTTLEMISYAIGMLVKMRNPTFLIETISALLQAGRLIGRDEVMQEMLEVTKDAE